MSPAETAPESSSGRPAFSCVRCAERKVKCDRQTPCGACVRHNAECVFKPPPPARRKAKRVKDDTLKGRIRRYEALLHNQGIDPNQAPDNSEQMSSPKLTRSEAPTPGKAVQMPTPTSNVSEPDRPINQTQLFHGRGRSKFVDNSLWTRVVEEFHDPNDVLDDSYGDASDADTSEDDFDHVVGVSPALHGQYPHPPKEHIQKLWNLFVNNVDPLTKIVHVPTLEPVIEKAVNDIGHLPRSLEALMFAIYSVAVLSLKDVDTQNLFGEPRKALLSRHIAATKVALSRAKFMGTTSIMVLQALVLHILSVRDTYGHRTVHTLTGVAVRIAEGMGVNFDGTALGLPPFETEVRRRIWWQLKLHDFRTAELGGLAKFQGIDTGPRASKLPSNVNDAELYPGMTSPAVESEKVTDMIFCAVRSELGRFATNLANKSRQQGGNDGLSEATLSKYNISVNGDLVKEMEDLFETKYLRYLDPSQPLQLMAMFHARSAVEVGRFLSHHPRRWMGQEQVPEAEKEYVWKVAIRLLEQYHTVQSNPQLQPFAWHVAYFFQWHAFIHVLATLQTTPLMPNADKTWRLVESVYQHHPDLASNTKKTINRAVGNLCLKAFHSREVAVANEGQAKLHVPDYIARLRQQRDAAMAKKMSQESNRKGRPLGDDVVPQLQTDEARARPPKGRMLLRPTLETRDSQRNSSFHISSSAEAPMGTADNTGLWFNGGFDADFTAYQKYPLDVNTDFLFTQDQSMDGLTDQTINWTQWDAWLSDATFANLNQALQN